MSELFSTAPPYPGNADSDQGPPPGAAAGAPPEDPLADLKNLAAEGLKDAKEKWEKISKETEKYIRENPGKSVLAALGIGVFLGVILKD
jgi:ElaB/YqjD/DUF883 family membrane-anchored ribosome-binding protein